MLSVHLNTTHTCAQPDSKIFIVLYKFGKRWVREKKERGERKRVGTGNMEVKGGGRKGDMQGTEEELAGYHQKVAGLQAVVRMRLLQ